MALLLDVQRNLHSLNRCYGLVEEVVREVHW